MQEKAIQVECSHCHQPCDERIPSDHGSEVFCCYGCKVVYELLEGRNDHLLKEKTEVDHRYLYLDHPEIKEKLLDFKEGAIEKITLDLPQIHCSSCIFLLENLGDLKEGILQVKVAFSKRKAEILYNSDLLRLSSLAWLLEYIGYKPQINARSEEQKDDGSKQLLYKLGVAGFFFGNTMLLALPEYFDEQIYLDRPLLIFFRYLMLAFSLPVLIYSASDYFKGSVRSLRAGILSIDLPIVIGLAALFLRSVYEVVGGIGSGYFDSLTGLVFFLTLGKWYQRKTYERFSFDKDYRSFLPLAATILKDDGEATKPIDQLKAGDRILLRNGEVLPTDGTLRSEHAQLDYSYITGESLPVEKKKGNNVFAGGRLSGRSVEVEVSSTADHSYLSSLWKEDLSADVRPYAKTFTDKISQFFTPAILIIASLAALWWYSEGMDKALLVFTAVLIVACPCALALAEPFASGSAMRWMGKYGLYLRNAGVLNDLVKVDTLVFDKTGTLTDQGNVKVRWKGEKLGPEDLNAVYTAARNVQHHLARSLEQSLEGQLSVLSIQEFSEAPGEGIVFTTGGVQYKMGKASFTGQTDKEDSTAIYILRDGICLGHFTFYHQIRTHLPQVLHKLSDQLKLVVLSGDNPAEMKRFRALFGPDTELLFNQSPKDKLAYLKKLKSEDRRCLMIGDGLNDAGALLQSDVGISLCEEHVNFFPASDALLKARSFRNIPMFLELAHRNRKTVNMAFALSIAYNSIGLAFAVSGILSPLICAILMPLSSISVVAFTTLYSRRAAKKLLIS